MRKLPTSRNRLAVWLLLAALTAQARFCTQLEVAGTITKGDSQAINAVDGTILEVRSLKTDSQLVQKADIQMQFTIPQAVSLVDVAGIHLTVVAQASMPHLLTLLEVYHFKSKQWVAVDSFEIDIEQQSVDSAIANAKECIDPKTRILLLRLRTKKETADAYFIKIDAVELVGIRPEGLADYGDLFAVPGDSLNKNPAKKSTLAVTIKRLKDDWDQSFQKGGRLIPIGDWESTADHQRKMKEDWRKNWTNNGKVRSLESQLR